jgi:hypothetical protein
VENLRKCLLIDHEKGVACCGPDEGLGLGAVPSRSFSFKHFLLGAEPALALALTDLRSTIKLLKRQMIDALAVPVDVALMAQGRVWLIGHTFKKGWRIWRSPRSLGFMPVVTARITGHPTPKVG